MNEISCKIIETEAERQAHFAIRRAIFVEEQGLFAGSDMDEHDTHAIHIIAVDHATGRAAGAVRVYEAEPGVWYGGRMAVLKEYRQQRPPVGPLLDRLAERTVSERGCRRFLAYIQLQCALFPTIGLAQHWRADPALRPAAPTDGSQPIRPVMAGNPA